MAKFSDIFKYFSYLPFIDVMVKAVEDLSDQDTTKDKIADAIEDILAGAAPLIVAKNPALASEVNAAVAGITKYLEQWSAAPALVPANPPPATSIYDVWTVGLLPDDATLLRMGFKGGDFKWKSVDGTQWLVGHQGGIVGGGATLVGPIGG